MGVTSEQKAAYNKKYREKKKREKEQREVKEEIGLDCKVGPLLGIYEFIQMNQIIIAYDVFLSQGEIKLDKEELVDFKLVSSSDLRPWPSGTGQAVKKWLHQRGIENKEIEFKKLKKN